MPVVGPPAVGPDGAIDDPPLLLHAASMPAPTVMAIAYFAKLEICFIWGKRSIPYYEMSNLWIGRLDWADNGLPIPSVLKS